VTLLVTANAIMAISQTNIASVYLQVSSDFHQTLFGLGLLTSVYFAGYGIFEVPGSILAAKVGPKKMVVLGGFLTSSALVWGALAPDFGWLALSRILAGVGYGLLFAPTLVLTIRNLGDSSVGLGAALATVSFSIGGFAGIFGWSVLSAATGWRYSLIVEFVVTIVPIVAVLVLLPKDELKPDFKVRLSHLRGAITSRPIIALALCVFGGFPARILKASSGRCCSGG
jgi:predicted MFS family arabinose efflux permease